MASLAARLSRRTASLATDLSHRTGSLAAGLSRQTASVGQKTAGLRRQARVGQRPMFRYQEAAGPNRAATPDTKGVVVSGPREDRPPRRNRDPGDITASPTDINAAFNLGVLLEERKDLPAAEAAYRRADERGHAAASSNLGVLLEGQGDRTGAEAAYRRADQRGETNGSFNLGVLLEETDDLGGAEAAYRRAERSADVNVAQLARAARLELIAGIGVSGVAHNGGDVHGT
jgi:TPR repeat protein